MAKRNPELRENKMASRKGNHVAMFIENNHNDHEVWYPIYRMREEGARVVVIGPEKKEYKSKLGQSIHADIAAAEAEKELYDAIIIPGGYAPDLMRLSPSMISIVAQHAHADKPVAAICHGSWLLASADIVRGKRVTGAPSIKDDLVNAGGLFEDSEVVVDGTLVTSRKPDDLPAFCREIIALLPNRNSFHEI